VRGPFTRRPTLPDTVRERAGLARGDRPLATAQAADGGWLVGTRDALVVVGSAPADAALRIPWERVESADWDREGERLRVVEVAEFGAVRPVHVFTLPDPGPLLPMVRERVTASVLLQRRVDVRGRLGLTLVARRAPRGTGEVVWAYELDPGLDPDDPVVRRAAEEALREAMAEVGMPQEPPREW
jgi:hypothetical protein